jgi:hypothetical protein
VNSNVSNLLSAADVATQRGGGDVADFSYEDFLGWGDPNAGDPWNSPMPADTPGWEDFTGWGGDETQTGWYQNADLDTSGGGGNWLQTILGGLGGAGKLLAGSGGAGGGAGLLGPLLSSLGSVGGGAIGSNAANEAARLQAAAANRALSLQEAQWLQNQANQAPWMQAGREALPQLQQLAGQGQQAPFQPGATISNASYGMPGATPTWAPAQYFGPQAVNAGDYRWNPQQGPRAADYRYTPGQTPDASQYTYTPGAVPTLSGQELLANDPGVAFRLAEGRKALEGSAAAKGGLLSGPTLAALQRQGQELSSQEYSNAFARAAQQAQMREQWQQQATGQNFGQAMSAAQLREQVQQIASQQGWSQSQAEAAFREAMASQSSQQGFAQALGAQGQQWQQGFASEQDRQRQQQQFDETYYNRLLGQNQLIYGRDWQQNMADYERSLQAYNSQTQNQNTQWNRLAGLAGVGQTAVNQLGTGGQNNASQQASILSQLGNAQAGGVTGPANAWMNTLQNIGGAATNYTNNLGYQQGLQAVLAGLNR